MTLFEGLADRSVPCWHTDFPTEFKSNSVDKPGRNVRRHYRTMTMAQCREFAAAVERYVAPDAVLFHWITGALLVTGEHIPVMRAMGFEPTAMGFVWIKLNKNASPQFFTMADIFMGGGFTTRKNAEFCILGKRGKSLRLDSGVLEPIIAPVREHSRKPEEVFRRIERYCAGPRVDLFGRQQRPGWRIEGNEAFKFNR